MAGDDPGFSSSSYYKDNILLQPYTIGQTLMTGGTGIGTDRPLVAGRN